MVKTKMKLANKILLMLLLAFAPVFAFGQQRVFTDVQTKTIKCAQEKVVALYNYLDASASPEGKLYKPDACGESKPLPPPKWLEDLLQKEMSQRVLWQLPNAQTGSFDYLSEAEMWRRTFSVIYDFFDFVDSINEGKAYQPQEIMEKFGNIRARMLVETERLNTNPELTDYNMRDSMQGRGRSMMATLDLINKEMDSVAESFLSSPKQSRAKFKKSVLAVAILSNNLYGDMIKHQTPTMPQDFKKGMNTYYIVLLLMLIGMLAIFFSVYKIVSDKNDEIMLATQKYMQKSSAWADDYSRQFLDINVKYIVLGTLAFFAFVGLLFGVIFGGIFGFIVFSVFFSLGMFVGLKMPGLVLGVLKKRRGEKINAQLMDALILLSNSLKSGMDIVQGFDMVSRDLRPPISDEFGLVIKNYKLGTPFEKALEGMEERVESRLLSYMVKAIVLQRQVGGNLTKIFERIVENIREESKLEEKLQAMTAQQRIQALVVGVMPWIMVGIMFVFQPETMKNFYSSKIGAVVLILCIIWIVIGIKMVNKLGEIKV